MRSALFPTHGAVRSHHHGLYDATTPENLNRLALCAILNPTLVEHASQSDRSALSDRTRDCTKTWVKFSAGGTPGEFRVRDCAGQRHLAAERSNQKKSA